jgi:membrane fusion protein, multidrug efflux system
VLLIALIGFGIYWWTTLRWFESTDDAYTQADAVVIAPKVAGYASRLLVTDNQRVKAGDVLVQIDPRDYQAALDQALANQEKDQATLGNAQLNLARDAALVGANLAVTRQQYDTDKATVAADQAIVDADKAQVEQARLNLGYTTITAPVDGAVGDRSVQLGAYLQPGQGLMSIVPMGRAIYVVANFKETQIERMFRGETVDLAIDTFPGIKFTGKVDSLAPGSGAQFALLPPENATGYFTKIVQRVPVKIVIDQAPRDRLDQLRPGLSVEADVDSRTAPPEGERQTLVAPGLAPGIAPRP